MKKITILLAIASLLILNGCNGFSSGASYNQGFLEDISKGKEGLVMNFLPQSPPKQVYEDDVFPVSVELENIGTYDIKRGILLINVENDNLAVTDGSISQDLDLVGKSVGNPYGDKDKLTFRLKAKKLGVQTETLTSKIMATSCYKYKTEFSKNVCIDPDFYSIKKTEKSCTIKTLEFSSGQGAPIEITRVEPTMVAQDEDFIHPRFEITINNAGNGEVIKTESYNDMCSSAQVNYEDLNKVSVRAYLAEEELNCKPEEFKLSENEDFNTIRCSLDNGIGVSVPAYTSILSVILDYGYTETISKDIEIRQLS